LPDKSTPLAVVNILYNVGARNEEPNRTGFAHLFEHLMFGGSANIPDYDRPLQMAGGENNAFTNNDFTNYYISLPPENLDIAFWLESDRMNELAFTPKSLEVQRQVVVEEFKQRNLNQPYGDVYLHLRPLAYQKHSYNWPTIGKSVEHIQDACMDEVKDFYYKHYAPNNAILVVAGNVESTQVIEKVNHWFGDISKREISSKKIPIEPKQLEPRTLKLERNVPTSAFYKAYHMCGRLHPDYYACDLISDILSNGKSSWFEQELIRNKQMFSEVDAYITGSFDPGLFIISAKPHQNFSFKKCEQAIDDLFDKIINGKFESSELEKVKNRIVAMRQIELSAILNKAINLAYYEWLGDANLINSEDEKYLKVDDELIKKVAKLTFDKNNCSTLYYMSK
jgi:predicted Zn-dependent peptidase